jgi:hypothetical protein
MQSSRRRLLGWLVLNNVSDDQMVRSTAQGADMVCCGGPSKVHGKAGRVLETERPGGWFEDQSQIKLQGSNLKRFQTALEELGPSRSVEVQVNDRISQRNR